VKKILLIALGMASALHLCAQDVSLERVAEDVVVTVEGEKITHGEIMKGVQINLLKKSEPDPSQKLSQMYGQIYQNVTDSLVANVLLTKAAEKSGLTVNDAELDKEIATLEANAPNGTSLKEALAEIDYGEWKADLRRQMMVRKLIEEKTVGVAATKEKQGILRAYIDELKKNARIEYH
jgi:hypothetical protein